MQRTYYVGEGPEAKAVIDAVFVKLQAFRDAGRALVADWPKKALFVSANGGDGHIIGFGFPSGLNSAEMYKLGLVLDVMRPGPDGEFVQCFKPNNRSNNGKALRKRMNAANKLCVNFSDAAIQELELGRCLVDGYKLHFSSAGCKGDKLFVSIPGEPGDGVGRENYNDSFPEVPTWFREPEGDEFRFFLKYPPSEPGGLRRLRHCKQAARMPVLWNKKGEEMNSLILNPGSEESLQAGCCCPYMDNGHGRGYLGDGEKFGWVINSACPLHGEGTATWAKWQEEE